MEISVEIHCGRPSRKVTDSGAKEAACVTARLLMLVCNCYIELRTRSTLNAVAMLYAYFFLRRKIFREIPESHLYLSYAAQVPRRRRTGGGQHDPRKFLQGSN